MISVIPCWIISIGLLLVGTGLLVAANNEINILISFGVILIAVGFIWDIISGNMSEITDQV